MSNKSKLFFLPIYKHKIDSYLFMNATRVKNYTCTISTQPALNGTSTVHKKGNIMWNLALFLRKDVKLRKLTTLN